MRLNRTQVHVLQADFLTQLAKMLCTPAGELECPTMRNGKEATYSMRRVAA